MRLRLQRQTLDLPWRRGFMRGASWAQGEIVGRSGTNWGAEFPRFTIDLTGDGKADILGFGTDGVWVSLDDGGGRFSTPSFVPNDSSGQGQFGYARGMADRETCSDLG
jgi:hypothetical protein